MLRLHIHLSSRALVLQGGGPLGAYEAGVFRVLHDWFSIQKSDKNFFDVIAGTSIGAINAAIIISYVKERRKEGQQGQLTGIYFKDKVLIYFELQSKVKQLVIRIKEGYC